MKTKRRFFITGTDTGVGKTVATATLGVLLQEAGYNVGVCKPIQCAGDDAEFLTKILNVADPIEWVNPYYVPEPLSPHLALRRKGVQFDPALIRHAAEELEAAHDLLLFEGAGGLMVPLASDYFVRDLICELNAEAIIVARLGLGTINHTLLTIEQLRSQGIRIAGLIFSDTHAGTKTLPEKTNPQEISALTGIPGLGTIPFMKEVNRDAILKRCNAIDVTKILRTPVSIDQRLADWDREYIWHPFTQMKDWNQSKPVIVDRAEGSYLIDTEGRRYLDGISSLWVTVHGHRKAAIDRAIAAQIQKVSHSTLLGLSNTPAVELAKHLIDIAPEGLAKVFYSDNGSTSVEIAIKMAYQYWQNTGRTEKIHLVHLANSYHGDTLGSVSIGGIDLFHKVYRNLTFKTIQLDFPDCYRAPAGKTYPDYAFEALDRFEDMLKERHSTMAALVVEPLVQGAAGMIVWPKGILRRMWELCRKYDIFLIADEVATGFGRTGTMFACEQEGVVPDFLCLAKGLTGGYLPLAATLTSQKVYDGFVFDYQDQKTFFHGHTYTGNPLACAAALANLEVFRKERVLNGLQPKIKYLSERLSSFYNLPSVGDIRQKGFMVGIELVKDKSSKEPFPWEERIGVQVCQEARSYGVMLRPLGNVIVLMPPLSISIEELNKLLNVIYSSIERVLDK